MQHLSNVQTLVLNFQREMLRESRSAPAHRSHLLPSLWLVLWHGAEVVKRKMEWREVGRQIMPS